MGFKKYNGSTWQPITPKKLKGIPYTGTLPATLTGTKAGYLHRYKIYGNTEQTGTPTPENPIMPSECGEKTENICPPLVQGGIMAASGEFTNNSKRVRTNIVKCKEEHDYVITAGNMWIIVVCAYNSENEYVTTLVDNTTSSQTPTKLENITIPSGCDGIAIGFGNASRILAMTEVVPSDAVGYMLNSGSTALPYEPYGYKLPLTSGSTPVDIYIGDDTLSTDEYVDSGTGKIYRMVGGVLTPVDPPVPFPQIPTSAGSTTISWAGEGLAPSEFDSIQEWVDIPTYTYTNGAWVADN